MAVLHDMQCSHCGEIVPDLPLDVEGKKCICLRGVMEILWSSTSSRPVAVHVKERTVVWRHPATGKALYPGRNDTPMPERYRRQGYERHELPTLKHVEQFEKTAGVRSEMAWYDRGTGRGFDDKDR